MQIIKEDKLGLLLLKISHAIFLTYSLLGHIDAFSAILKATTMFAIVLLIFNFFLQYDRFKPSEFLWYAGLMVLSLVHSYFSNNYGFFKLMLFAGSMRKVNFKNIVRFDMYIRAALIALVSILCIAGIAPDNIYMYEGITRRSMGFTNPNTLGIAVFVLVCDILYVNEFRLNLKSIISVGALSTWLFAVARCRTAAYVIIGIMAIALIYNIRPQIFTSGLVKAILYATPVVLGVVTIIIVNQYINGEAWALHINEFLSGRIKSIANFVRLLKPTVFGQPINETLDKTLDNTFAFVLYDLGLVVTFVFAFAYFRMIKKNIYVNTKLCLIMLGFMIYGLNEHLWINVDYNVFMLAFCANPMIEMNASEARSERSKSRNIKIRLSA